MNARSRRKEGENWSGGCRVDQFKVYIYVVCCFLSITFRNLTERQQTLTKLLCSLCTKVSLVPTFWSNQGGSGRRLGTPGAPRTRATQVLSALLTPCSARRQLNWGPSAGCGARLD